MSNSTHNDRQTGFFPTERLENSHVLIVGCGGVGRRVAADIGAVRPGSVTICDPDRIEEINIGPQRWSYGDIGEFKVDALMRELSGGRVVDSLPVEYSLPVGYCRRVDEDILREFFRRGGQNKAATYHVFCCIDNLEGRKNLRRMLDKRAAWLYDGRVGGESLRIVTCNCATTGPEEYIATVPETGFEAPCSERMGTHAAATTAAWLIMEWSRVLRGWPAHKNLVMNLKSMEVLAEDWIPESPI